MLVLKRHKRERIILEVAGEEIVIEVCDVGGSSWARLGVEASDAVRIWREEIRPGKHERRPA